MNVGSFSAEDILLAVDGSGDIVAEDLQVERLELAINGSGDVRLAGNTDTFIAGIDGSGEIDAQGLQAQEVSLGISGAGEAEVCALTILDVSVSGSGDITILRRTERAERQHLGRGRCRGGRRLPVSDASTQSAAPLERSTGHAHRPDETERPHHHPRRPARLRPFRRA